MSRGAQAKPEKRGPKISQPDFLFPALILPTPLENFIPVTADSTNRETTEADIAILNNHLILCQAVIPHAKTFSSLCMLSVTVAKLIEVRRKVKELPYGSANVVSRGTGMQFLE